MQGLIKRLVRERGFGFILGPDSTEYFFHSSALVQTRFDTLEEGERVTFEVEESRGGKGPRAGMVKAIKAG